MGEVKPNEASLCAQKMQRKPLRLDELLIPNVNSWGNVDYNIPLRTSYNETRTGTSIAHRLIPAIPHAMDCKIDEPLPERICGRDMVVTKETYRTTSSAYCIQPNPNKAMERADKAMNCKNVKFMTALEKKILSKHIFQPTMISEMKDKYRGLKKPALAPSSDITIKRPDPDYIFDVVASGRNEVACIPETNPRGFRKLLDPYFTTHRATYRPYTEEEQYQSKDIITFYSEFDTPRVRGFGPRHKEVWMPLKAKPFRQVFDRVKLKKEFKEVASCHNPVNNIKGVFISETKKKFTHPYSKSQLASWGHGETFDLAPFPPNPFQTNIAPFMYCSDYCHIAQGTRPCCVVDSFAHQLPKHRECVQKYVVSRDFEI